MSKIEATVVADSTNPQNDRLTSVLVTMPRIILSEMNTHRMLSKNTSSSRAIPFNKMVEAVQNVPFIPIAWQGSEYFNLEESNYAKRDWLDAKRFAVDVAQRMYKTGVTKQLCNRLLEPFMWTTMLITGSKEGWNNFFELRCPQYKGSFSGNIYKSRKEAILSPYGEFRNFGELDWLNANKGQAEIHMMALAEAMYDAMNESIPKELQAGEWHIPFRDKINEFIYIAREEDAVKVSTAMAARTYYTVVGEEKELDYETLIGLHDRLLAQNPPHSSPMEHCARAMTMEEYESHVKGTIEWSGGQYDKQLATEGTEGWCRNFKGFIQYRHILEK